MAAIFITFCKPYSKADGSKAWSNHDSTKATTLFPKATINIGAQISFEVRISKVRMDSHNKKQNMEESITKLSGIRSWSKEEIFGIQTPWKTDAGNCKKLLNTVLKTSIACGIRIDNFLDTVNLLESNGYLTSQQASIYQEAFATKTIIKDEEESQPARSCVLF